MSAREAVDLAGLRDVRAADWSRGLDESPDPYNLVVAYDTGDGWAVLYQVNGYPEQFATGLAARPQTREAVSVFWNVNRVSEFGYWRAGMQLVRFGSPDERRGAEPDVLLAAM